jgi:hypothetical protein
MAGIQKLAFTDKGMYVQDSLASPAPKAINWTAVPNIYGLPLDNGHGLVPAIFSEERLIPHLISSSRKDECSYIFPNTLLIAVVVLETLLDHRCILNTRGSLRNLWTEACLVW